MKMKKLIALGAVLTAVLGFVTESQASFHGNLLSLQVTNLVALNATNAAYPSLPATNVYATNATASNVVYTTVYPTNYSVPPTGLGLDISAYDSIGINVQGQVVSTNTNSMVITLVFVTSQAVSAPVLLYGTNIWTANATNVIQNDWITQNVSATPISIAITVASNATSSVATNWLNFQTNLSNTTLASGANYIGLYSIGCNGTNTSGNFITNFFVGVNEKQVPRLFAY